MHDCIKCRCSNCNITQWIISFACRLYTRASLIRQRASQNFKISCDTKYFKQKIADNKTAQCWKLKTCLVDEQVKMRPDSLLRFWRYRNLYLLTVLTYLFITELPWVRRRHLPCPDTIPCPSFVAPRHCELCPSSLWTETVSATILITRRLSNLTQD